MSVDENDPIDLSDYYPPRHGDVLYEGFVAESEDAARSGLSFAGWASDPVSDPDEIRSDRFEQVCDSCHLVAHCGGFTDDNCRDCAA